MDFPRWPTVLDSPSEREPGVHTERRARRSYLRARLVLYALVLPWITVCLWKTTEGTRWYALQVAILLPSLLSVARVPQVARSRWFHRIDLALWHVIVTVLMLEAATRLYLSYGHPPGWISEEPDQVRYRLDPAREWLGKRPNSLGFYDEEFTANRRPGVLRVVALGDSYAVGLVPYEENYLTLADVALGDDVEILNLGIAHMAVREYVTILRSEGLSLDPDAVLVGIYIGNDIQPDPTHGLFSRGGSQALLWARRMFQISLTTRQGLRWDDRDLFRIEPDGSRVELPLMSIDRHLAHELKHLRRIFRPPEGAYMHRAWRDTEHALSQLVGLCRERGLPIFATLAPDEIQVSNRLLGEVADRFSIRASEFDLGYPNRRLLALLGSLGVPTLDFTAALQGEGERVPTYHRRGAHWNGSGNSAAARALVPWLAGQLGKAFPDRRPGAPELRERPSPELRGGTPAGPSG